MSAQELFLLLFFWPKKYLAFKTGFRSSSTRTASGHPVNVNNTPRPKTEETTQAQKLHRPNHRSPPLVLVVLAEVGQLRM